MSTKGTYWVGTKSFEHKIEALLHAKSSSAPVRWDFFDSVFSKVNWTTPLRIPLGEVYKSRAVQLREKYKYLVLHYSGGSDSRNILKTFLDNKIHLDEIFVKWPLKFTEKTPISYDTDPTNYNNEWHLSIKPSLDFLKAEYPHIKITVKDISDDYKLNLSTMTDREFNVMSGGHNISPAAFTKNSTLSDLEALGLDNSEVGSIWGSNKPQIKIGGVNAYVYFIDGLLAPGSIAAPGRTLEPFYWTPDYPEIVVQQAHAVLDVIRVNKPLQFLLSAPALANKDLYDELIKTVVYPAWDRRIFQVKKNFGFENKWDIDLFRSGDFVYEISRFRSLTTNLLSAIDKQHMFIQDTKIIGIGSLISPLYFIGTV